MHFLLSMDITRLMLTYCALCLVSLPVQAKELFVAPDGHDNRGNGSLQRPWKTIQHGLNQAKPGDTVFLRGGTYNETVVIETEGLPDRPITLKAYADEKPILDGRVPIIGWERCRADDEGLTRSGIRHPNATDIYKARIPADVAKQAATLIFEEGVRSRLARWPDQKRGEGMDPFLFSPVPEESFQYKDRLLDPVHLNSSSAQGEWTHLTRSLNDKQLKDYWQGASLYIWMRSAGNYSETREITAYENNALILDRPLRRNFAQGDQYSIINHPHTLSGPGEFYLSPEADRAGLRTLYYWPQNVAALENGVATSIGSPGIHAVHKSHFVIDGLTIRYYGGQGIFFRRVVGSQGRNDGIHVLNCTITDTGADGIYLQESSGSVVADNQVWRVGGRGVFVTTGDDVRFERNRIGETDGTSMSFYTVKRGRMVDNRIYGAIGIHSNGSSCYLGCEDILIARNIYYNGSNATFQNIGNLTVFGNIWDGHNEAAGMLAMWPNSRNSDLATNGNLLYLHNTIIRGRENNAAIFRYNTIHVHNNLIGGSAHWEEINHQSHNGWLGRAWKQRDRDGWKIDRSSWHYPEGNSAGSATERQLNSIFTRLQGDNPDDLDYSLTGTPRTNPAISKGREIASLLREKGVLETFPDFDFSVDIAGRPWAVPPSLGAYEYAR